MPLKMSQILRKTSIDRIEKARTTVKVIKVKYGTSKRTKLPTAASQVYSLDKVGGKTVRNKYVTTIEFMPKERVRLSCSCPDFMYRWEYALWKRGSAELKFGNGDAPDDTNPSMVPGCCIAKGSLVQTAKGPKRIEDVRAGDFVWTLNGNFTEVTAQQLTRRNAATLKVVLKDGREFEATPDHLVLAVEPNAAVAKWTRVDKLSMQHLLVTSLSEKSSLELKDLDAEALVLGYLVAEQGEVGYAPMESEVSRHFQAAYQKRFHQEFNHSGSTSVIKEEDVASEVWSTLKIKACSSAEKVLPEYVFTQPFEYRMSLIYALFQGDGWISKDRKAATYATQSLMLAKQVSSLLYGLGIEVGFISEQSSGVCDRKIFLVRLTRAGAKSLSKRLPPLTKYGEEYFENEDTTDQPKLPFFAKAIQERVAAYVQYKMTRQEIEAGETLITLRDAAEKLQVSTDKFIAYFRKHHKASLIKVRLPHSSKPLLAVTKKLAWQVYAEKFALKKGALPRLNSEWRRASWSRLRGWIQSLPEIVKPQVQAYYSMMREASYSRIESITPSKGDVYDLTVPSAEHFTANGVVVHNCKHLIALYDYLQERDLVVEQI